MERNSSFAIVIEWENARFAELARTRAMLASLRAQLAALARQGPISADVILLYNEFQIDGRIVHDTVAECFPPADVPARVQIIPTKGFTYYQQKNFGATQTDADIVILLDCDIIPEDGWLAGMLSTFADPKVQVVAGETYVSLEGWYSKAFALFWFFSLRDPSDRLATASLFHANNVGWRRATFLRWPFPDVPGYRSQGDVLVRDLHDAGITIYLQKKARASHPVPLGLWYFTARALHSGRDRVIAASLIGRRNRPMSIKESYWMYRQDLIELWRNIWPRYREVQLGVPGAVFATGVGFAYFSLRFLGAVLTGYSQGAVPRLFKI